MIFLMTETKFQELLHPHLPGVFLDPRRSGKGKHEIIM